PRPPARHLSCWERTVITPPPGYNPGPARLFASHRPRRCHTCCLCSPLHGAQARDPVRVAVGRQRSDATPTTGTLYLGGG
ncbi:hypothetical protein, partial [Corallococcus exercitus]